MTLFALCRMKRFLPLMLLCVPLLACAWGQEGHCIVAELAQRQLTPATREAAQKLMGPGVSLASLATWADTVAYATRQDTKGWHYVDIKLLLSSYNEQRDCVYTQTGQPDTPQTCIITAIQKNTAVLRNLSAAPQERREALKFLVHFVGDIHQPLHTVDEDAGGNRVFVSFLVQPNAPSKTAMTNLHAVWDTGIFRAQYYSWGEHLDALSARWFEGRPLPPLVDDCASAANRVECWALESHAIAAKPGYYVANNTVLDASYLKLVSEDRDRQLVRASMRLAALLNEVLGR